MAAIREREIEEEKDDLTEDLSQPFNPKDIDIAVELRSLDSIITRIKFSEIDMNTHFQRKGDLWNDAVMSRLIESILIRFPLPAFYFDATNDESWLIVDGLQRLSAIRRFILNTDRDYTNKAYSEEERKLGRHKPLILTGLEYLKEYEGMSYDQLPNTMRRRLNEAQITVYLIRPGTPEAVKYSVFYRINTGGLQLNAQEIRHALNQHGISASFLEEIAEHETFKKVVKISDKRMQDRELALRYLAFSIFGYNNYKPSMISFLNKTMDELNRLKYDTQRLNELKENLLLALSTCYYIFEDSTFTKSIASRDRGPLNRPLFEVWTVLLGGLELWQLDNLQQSKSELVDDFVHLLRTDKDFERSITSSTTGYNQVQYRFGAIRRLVSKYIE